MKRRLFFFWLFVMLAVPAQAQPLFPQRGVEIIDTLYAKSPALAHSEDDDDRRLLTLTIIQQLVFEFPGDGWGGKSASSTRPFSKDAIARQVGDRLYIWDWQSGTTRRRQVQAGQRGEDVTGQTFIPVVGINHLLGSEPTTAAPVPIPTPTSSAPPLNLAPIQASIDALTDLTGDFQAAVGAQIDREAERIRHEADVHHQEEMAAIAARSAAAPPVVADDPKGFFKRWIVEKVGPVAIGAISAWLANK